MAGEAITPINGYMNPYSSYLNQASLYNIYDTDTMYSSPLGMGGSIFGGGMMPFMPTFGGGMNYDSYFNNMKSYLNFTSDYQYQMAENQRNNDLRLNAVDEGIQNAASVLNEKIAANEQEQIQQAYETLLAAVAAKYPNADKKAIINRAKTEYARIYRTSITDDIRQKGNNSFLQGLYQSLTLGLADNKTAEENISALTGQPVSRTASMEKTLGRATGGFIVGSGTVLGASALIPAVKGLKGKWAILAGLAGAAIAGLGGIFSSQRTEA